MGLHDICKDPLHHFDRSYDVEMLYDISKEDYCLVGMCLECGRMRVVYVKQLKDAEVIKRKMGVGYVLESDMG